MTSWPERLRPSGGGMRRFVAAKAEPDRTRGLKPDHAALTEARTLFPSTVVDASDAPRLLVPGYNNAKLGRKVTKGSRAGWPIFQLSLEERATCPTSCALWAGCYGNSMHLARRHRDDGSLTYRLDRELEILQRKRPAGFLVRLHTLGDFYSRPYVQFWGEALDAYPALHVFGYTARDLLDPIGRLVLGLADERWDRFAIRQSSHYALPQGAITVDSAAEAEELNAIVCPAQTGATACCGTCGLCWTPAAQQKTIAFIRHGMKSRGAKT